MKYEIRVRPTAERDLSSTRDWYRGKSSALAERFAAEIGAAMQAIRENPAMFPRVYGEVRRAMTRRFPYAIYFIVDEKRISVLRVLHQARSSRNSPTG